MHHKLIYSTLLLALAAVIGACNAADTANVQKPVPGPRAQNVHPDGARRVTIDELVAMMKEGKAYVVDVRTEAAFDQGHIPGAHLIPANEVMNHLNELPRDKMIVTYCS